MTFFMEEFEGRVGGDVYVFGEGFSFKDDVFIGNL